MGGKYGEACQGESSIVVDTIAVINECSEDSEVTLSVSLASFGSSSITGTATVEAGCPNT
jgi:hypothetical protein